MSTKRRKKTGGRAKQDYGTCSDCGEVPAVGSHGWCQRCYNRHYARERRAVRQTEHSNEPGIYRVTDKRGVSWHAAWTEGPLDNRCRRTRAFSVAKYGDKGARDRALVARREGLIKGERQLLNSPVRQRQPRPRQVQIEQATLAQVRKAIYDAGMTFLCLPDLGTAVHVSQTQLLRALSPNTTVDKAALFKIEDELNRAGKPNGIIYLTALAPKQPRQRYPDHYYRKEAL